MRALHISDTHGYAAGTSDAMALAASMGVPVIHTGDMVPDYHQQSISYLDMGKILPVIGNHDAINESGTDPSGYNWHDKPSQKALRKKFFDPFPTQGLTFPDSNATWWHKDMEGCRVIGLDITALGADLANEVNWLGSVLNTMPTLVLAHIAPHNLVYSANGFTYAAYFANTSWYDPAVAQIYPGVDKLSDAVFRHAELTGTPTAMLCGHEHADGAIVHRGVPIIAVGSVIQDMYNNVYRSQEAVTSRLVANLVTFDETGLVVQRLGADSRTTGSRAKMWAYSYTDSRVTAIMCM